jgi:hypothetical protein
MPNTLKEIASTDPQYQTRDTRYQAWMLAICILFGVVLILNTMSANEGVWYWYAVLLNGGKRLYSDLHLPLQPFYVLESAGFMRLLGNGWLISKVPALAHLLVYALGLLLVVRYSDWPDLQKATVLGCAFFVSIASRLERFDDYHLIADSFQIYSVVLLLALQKSTSTRRNLLIVAALGVLSGLSITTRANDGGALLLAVAIAISCLALFKRLVSLVLFAVVAALTVILIVRLTGDSLSVYAANTLFKAAGLKGGVGGVLASPLLLPLYSLHFLLFRRMLAVITCCLGAVLAFTLILLPSVRSGSRQNIKRTALGLILTALPLSILVPWRAEIALLIGVSLLAVYVLYGFGVWAFIRFLRWLLAPHDSYRWNRLEILLLIPLGQLMSSSMSSGGQLPENFGPTTVLILLATIASPIRVKPGSARSVFLAIAVLLTCCGAIFKARVPYSWFSFEAKPIFVGRQWYRHPVYGPMFIEKDMLNFINPVCQNVGMNNPDTELLSLPYPFANSFCALAPWNGYVQTWFDTSTKVTIDKLDNDLQIAPPEWIFYQKQPDVLRLHEIIYNRARPLPFRDLDQLIDKRLAEGAWHVVYTSKYNSELWNTQWILIRTRR